MSDTTMALAKLGAITLLTMVAFGAIIVTADLDLLKKKIEAFAISLLEGEGWKTW